MTHWKGRHKVVKCSLSPLVICHVQRLKKLSRTLTTHQFVSDPTPSSG